MSQELLYQVDETVATITFNRPERMNALTHELEAELHRRLDEADADRAVRVTGSQFDDAATYTVKLEAATARGYREIVFGAIRDPLIIDQADGFIETTQKVVTQKIRDSLGLTPDDFVWRWSVYGKNGAMGPLEPLIEGGVVGMSGLVMGIRPGETACYRCAFPEAPPPGSVPGCAEAGVLGPAAGVIGSLQALEALKLLAGVGEPLTGAFLQLDLGTLAILRVAVRRRADCPDCGRVP